MSNVIFWSGNNFIFAYRIQRQLQKFFPKNHELALKNGDYYYRLWEYQKALEVYKSIPCDDDSKLCQTLLYNLGNAYYRVWEKTDDLLAKISFWQDSIKAYSKALNIGFDKDIKGNSDFVLEKLQWLTLPDRSGQKEEDTKEEPDQAKEELPSEEEKKDEDLPSQTETETWEHQQESMEQKTPSMKIDATKSWDEISLTPKEVQEIETYLHNLEEQEKQNTPLNHQPKQKDIFDIFNDGFFNGFDPNDHKW